MLSFSIDHTSFGWFIYETAHTAINEENRLKPLHTAYHFLSEHFPCDFAFYVTPVCPLAEINLYSGSIQKMKRENILLESGIFSMEGNASLFTSDKLFDIAQLQRWESLLNEYRGEFVLIEICQFLNSYSTQESMSPEKLRSLWVQFQQTTLNVLQKQKRPTKELLPVLEAGINARSIEELRAAIQTVTNLFLQEENTDKTDTDLEKKVELFVEDHIDQAFTVSDVASALYLNPDYLSRRFKNKTGISLKEYILNRKMQSAQILLQTTSLPVGVIASKLGYDNFSHFSQAYKKVMGISPTEERKE